MKNKEYGTNILAHDCSSQNQNRNDRNTNTFVSNVFANTPQMAKTKKIFFRENPYQKPNMRSSYQDSNIF
jgi:hypothetical protein